ncbi:MAG: flagellar basal body-associated FliL family protein [Pseudomonadota bacterium]
MADEATEETGEEGGGNKNVIIFAAVLVIAIGASVGGTIFFLGGDEEEAAVVAPLSNKPKTAIYHNMRPPYVINYLTGTKPRYLQAEFTVMARDEGAIEAVILHMPLIRSQIVGYLTEQNFLELQTQEGKETVRVGMVELINQILASYEVTHGIESVLITNFVLQ